MPYTEHATIPAYETAVFHDGELVSDRAKILWSGKEAPPEIGTEIFIPMNNCGPAIVTGYFTQDSWLGVLCVLTNPPEWFVKQNKGDPKGQVFGAEFRRV
jgi:hypothetical protein